MIKSLYERLFVGLYGWSRKVDGTDGAYTAFYASLSLSLGVLTNIVSLVLVVQLIFRWPPIALIARLSAIRLIALAVLIAALSYLYFGVSRRYRTLIKTYAATVESLAMASSLPAIAYLVLSWALFVALLFLNLKANR